MQWFVKNFVCFTKFHNHSISVFKNPCFQCEGIPEESSIDTNGTNESGFSALPDGDRDSSGGVYNDANNTYAHIGTSSPDSMGTDTPLGAFAWAQGMSGCTNIEACNYNANATIDNGSCWLANSGCSCADGENAEVDKCGVCNGDGIPEGACDCNGNIQDCVGKCGGGAEIDDCGICNGPGAIYECGCIDNGNSDDGTSIANQKTNWC